MFHHALGDLFGVKWTDLVTALAAVLGVPFIIYQIREVKLSIQGETLNGLYDHYHDVVNMFLERPYLRPYFYDNKPLANSSDPHHPDLPNQVNTMCELIAGVLERALVQEERLPGSAWKECWEAFIIERLKSPVLQDYIEEHHHFYVKRLVELSRASQPNGPHKRALSRASASDNQISL